MSADRFIIALTGASGARFGLRLLWQMRALHGQSDLIISPGFLKVLRAEEGLEIGDLDSLHQLLTARYGKNASLHQFKFCDYHDIGERAASGSSPYKAMIVSPCSMNTLAAIAHGLSTNLIERAADVSLKERRPLILCPRETPLSAIHLENMLTLTRAGAVIMPLMPGYYHKPATFDDLSDFMVDRIFRHAGVANRTIEPWQP